MRMKTILKEDATRDHTGHYPLASYVAVPAISTYGTFHVIEMLNDDELAHVVQLRKSLSN